MTDAIEVLLVDDEARNLDALEAVLADPSYRLVRADSADRALKALLAHDVAAIVLDINMPGMTGVELAQTIKGTKKFREVPILFLTGYALDDRDVMAGYGAGAVDYLTKPLNPQILRHKVAVFADLFRKTRALAELNDRLEQRVRERTAELEQSEAALRTAAVQKDEFLAILAHELRNPLAPLRTGLDLLLRAQQTGGEPSTRTLAAMSRQLDHMVRLVDDLLDISRISRGVLELKCERLDLAPVVRAAIEGARPFFDRRRQEVSVEARSVYAHADATRVAQILGNLLHNAAKFTPEGGAIEVALAPDDGHARIRVSDSGVGIRPDQIEGVFEMFARVDNVAARTEQGLGIGLALARRLADLHGGTLQATSRGEGEGATFTLSLPALATGESGAEQLDGAAWPDAIPLKILVIEDNADIADTLADLLRELGHRVWVARTGAAGVALVNDATPNVVLCDLGLPGMDGLEVCRSVRGMTLARQPVMVALTGWGRDDDRRRTAEAGFDHHLVKPVASDKLREILRTIQPEHIFSRSV